MSMKIVILAALAMGVALPAYAQNDNVGNGNTGFMNGNFNSNGNGGQGGTSNGNNLNYKATGLGAAPGLAAGAPACLGSVSVGASFYGGGFGAGTTYLEKACESRMLAEQLYRFGMKKTAVQVLRYNHPLMIATFGKPKQ